MKNIIKINIDSANRKLKEIETSIQNLDTTIDYSSLDDEAYKKAGAELEECRLKLTKLSNTINILLGTVTSEVKRHIECGQLTLPGVEIEYTDSDGSVSTVRVDKKVYKRVNRAKLDSITGIKQTLTGNESGVYTGCVRAITSRVEKACEQGVFKRDEVIDETTVDQILLDFEVNDKKGGE